MACGRRRSGGGSADERAETEPKQGPVCIIDIRTRGLSANIRGLFAYASRARLSLVLAGELRFDGAPLQGVDFRCRSSTSRYSFINALKTPISKHGSAFPRCYLLHPQIFSFHLNSPKRDMLFTRIQMYFRFRLWSKYISCFG